jgi:hypothetical protein
MQEAPPSPATRPYRKHQLRLYASVLAVLIVESSLIWLTIALISAGHWPYSLGPISIAGILILTFTTNDLTRLNSRARIEALLCDFDQISDLFARPKAYRHKALRRYRYGSIEPKSFIYGLYLDSNGDMMMPEMSDTPEPDYQNAPGPRITNDYGVSICINDDIVHVRKIGRLFHTGSRSVGYTDDKLFLVNFFDKHSGKGQKIAHLRIHKHDVRSDVVTGDFIIEGDEFEAFMKTLELLKHFNATPNFQP